MGNCLEYCNADFTDSLERNRIKREQTIAYAREKNVKAERMNRTLVEVARCILYAMSDLSETIWADHQITTMTDSQVFFI